uniref:kinesin-like protein KIF6 n=1 Tax=Styela clava TaxID=7725 RepID=UPI0019399C80|nr:kinesin-like protein KIF6 [Styela clava]
MSRRSSIYTYCRIAPSVTSNHELLATAPRRRQTERNKPLEYEISPVAGKRQNRKSILIRKTDGVESRFAFNEIFEQGESQEKVFTVIGKSVIENAISGYNSTVLAYGQTATGKTYTMAGDGYANGESETDAKGLIPRGLEYIWSELKSCGLRFSIKISCMEIYREKAYDLLDVQTHGIDKKTFATKKEVNCRMNRNEVRMQNLAVRQVKSLEEAMETFLEGSNNRAVSETYVNNASSRSHFVLTVYIQKELDTGVIKSKLNFVDLAGSERLGKGRLKNKAAEEEAKDNNRSLLFLREVIEATAISSVFKPQIFRNTLLTKILRDSFTGKCVTSLIATISSDDENIEETISTCQFAQSACKIKVKPNRNQTDDLKKVNLKLQEDNDRLSARISELEAKVEEPELTSERENNLKQRVFEFFTNNDPNAKLEVEDVKEHLNYCFQELKILGKDDRK